MLLGQSLQMVNWQCYSHGGAELALEKVKFEIDQLAWASVYKLAIIRSISSCIVSVSLGDLSFIYKTQDCSGF